MAPRDDAERSALYVGHVAHRRLRPKRHALGYRVFNLLLDLDETDPLAARLRLFSRNRFNLLSFHDGDHGDGSDTPLRRQIEALTARAGVELGGGRIALLCMPRMLGYVFNPISVYFCHDWTGRLACLVYEVSNTFGERHSYVAPVADGPPAPDRLIHQTTPKRFYVSPFLDMDLTYDFAIRPPAERVGVAITTRDRGGVLLTASFAGGRRELSDGAVVRTVLGHPLLTLKVVVGIHWEALKIWLKGVGLRPRPRPPAEPVTHVPLRTEST